MMNTNRQRGGRMKSGGRTDKRQIYNQDRQQRRPPVNDKNVLMDGLYKNQRLTHVIYSMVGANVQVQVKNGIVYEGILKTYSPTGDTVLEYAHMVEDSGNCGVSGGSAPSKERIISKLIVKHSDLVTLSASNLDLDYAVRDSFTDAGISKYNGEVKEKELRELQPWESEGGDEVTLEGCGDKSSNGWDPNDMFHTNAVQFNVQSSYDDSLEQYTTKLERVNSEEFRRKEQHAAKLAAEIERCDSYKRHIALENGEGEDEEMAFSSVVRPGESSSQPQPTGTGGPGKYIPPNKRTTGSGGMSKPARGGYSTQSSRSSSGHQQSPSAGQPASQPSLMDNLNTNEVARSGIPASTAGPTVKTSPGVHDHGPASSSDKQDHVSHIPHASKVEGKKSFKGRDEQIKELKEFSSNFKLDDNKDSSKDREKDREKERDKENSNRDIKEKPNIERKDSVSEEKDSGSEKVVPESKELSQPAVPISVVSSVQQGESVAVSSDEKQSESGSGTPAPAHSPSDKAQDKPVPQKSSLNPHAPVFMPKQQTQQIPTPPRPQTQSPMAMPTMNISAQPVYPGQGQTYIMPPTQAMAVLNNAQPPYGVRPKRAVVSMKQTDYSAVQAATGQPLLAQSAAQPGYMYLQHQMMPPQPTGYQMGQVMPMPAAQPSGPRFMTPTSMPGVQSSLHSMEQNNPSLHASQVFMTNPNQHGPLPGQMSSHFPHHNIIMTNQVSQPQQGTPINQPPPTGAGHHHPAPSPVHSNPNQQSMNPVPHPPSSGTPQPSQGYPQATLQAHPHPQPSPHNPTSPQNMQPLHYPFTSHPMQMHSLAGGQQFSVPQQSSVPTSVTYSMQTHAHHSPHMQHQYVMMPQHPTVSGQASLPHPHHQFPGHHMPGGMQPQLMSQSGVQGMPGQAPGQGSHPHPMQHFIQPVHPGSQHVQNYQSTQ